MTETRGPTLRGWLETKGGAASFRSFMEAALYDPAFGYYSRTIRSVGSAGDFSTSATLGTNMARGIASWVEEEGKHWPEIRNLIEVGPGTGKMHLELRQALGFAGRRRWRSHLVETSSSLKIQQRRTLRWHWGIRWHQELAAALDHCRGHALIFSHELVDAFPVTLLQQQEGAWQEVWLELTPEGGIVETLRPLESGLCRLNPAHFAEGQRVEVHQSYREWLAGWRRSWKTGSLLTIDYGGAAAEVNRRPPAGTLRGYRAHRRLTGIELYRNPGSCDLTADVNFTDLVEWGRELNLETVWLQTQSGFLAGRAAARSRNEEALASAQDAGGAFQCLLQRPSPGNGPGKAGADRQASATFLYGNESL